MENAIINVNGEIITSGSAQVSIFDRGFLYGDSLYEAIRTYHGQFWLLDEHLKRLENSARLCRMKLDQSLEKLKKELLRTFEAFRARPKFRDQEVYARLMVTRGVGKIGFSESSLLTPTQYIFILQPIQTLPKQTYQQGISVQISDRLRNPARALDPAMKSGNYLNSVLAYLEAEQQNFDDALLCNSDDHLTEGTTFNFFYCHRGIVATPPLDIGILEGVTRHLVLKVLAQLEIPVREVRFPKERLYEADEIFLTGSIKEILAITRVDSYKIGNGKQGPMTRRIHEAYRKAIGAKT